MDLCKLLTGRYLLLLYQHYSIIIDFQSMPHMLRTVLLHAQTVTFAVSERSGN